MSRYHDNLLRIFANFDLRCLNENYTFFVIIGTFIKKYRYKDFLSERDKQPIIDTDNLSQKPKFREYISKYLTIDRELWQKLNEQCRQANYIYPRYQNNFNELVYFLTSNDKPKNELRMMMQEQYINMELLQTLKKLIFQYGGD